MKRKLRTLSKFFKTKERVLVTLLFAFVLSCMSIGYAYYQSELSLEANISLLKGDLEITSASVYKTKNSSLTGDINIGRTDVDPTVILSSEYIVNLTGMDKNNYMNIKYTITNNSNKTYTYTGFNNSYVSYDGADPSTLRAPKLYGIIPGDKLNPGDKKEVNLIYIASSDVGDTSFDVVPSFMFDSSNPDVAVPSLTGSVDSHRLVLGDDGMASVAVKIINEFETTVKYTLSVDTDKYEVTNNSGSSSNYANTLTPSDIKETTVYFRLLDQTVADQNTTFDLVATLEDGTSYVIDSITVGKNIVPDLPYVIATTNERLSSVNYGWGRNLLVVDITNNYETPINNWTVYIYPKDTSTVVSASSDTNSTTYEDGIIKVTSKKAHDNSYVSIGAGETYTLDCIYVEYAPGKTFEVDHYEVYATVENINSNTGSIYTEAILNGADPVIPTNATNYFMPVIISNNGTVTAARASDEWYKYSEGRWANAVLLRTNRSETGKWYYQEGDVIDTRDIEQYLVWIPRFKYQIFNDALDNTKQPLQLINVFFESKSKPASTGTTNGSYLTHPAFTDTNNNGFWIGKFEVSGSTSAPRSLPNVSPVVNQGVYAFYTGIIGYNSNYNSHMLTNMEWGALAYLTQSKYGKGTTEVYPNGYASYRTGCGSTSATAKGLNTCVNAYGSSTSYPQSTTGNITGVFDASGGVSEYVGATIEGEQSGSYSTFYASTSAYRLGDAITETAGWFDDGRSYFTETEHYLVRGGNATENANVGINYFWHRNGYPGSGDGSRIAFDIK